MIRRRHHDDAVDRRADAPPLEQMRVSSGLPSAFYVMCVGQVDACKIHSSDTLYCKYSFNFGKDWSFVHGIRKGMSQIAVKSTAEDARHFTWNYPIDITFRSTNVHGWPQLVISCYGINLIGKDVIRGYGAVHLPTTPGRHIRFIRLYRPQSASLCQRLKAWITATPPEFLKSNFFAQSEGRDVTRVQSNGVVKVTFNITTKNMTDFGYSMTTEVSHLDEIMDEDEKNSRMTNRFQLSQ